VELEIQFVADIGVGTLLLGQTDIQPNGSGTCLVGTAIACFHDPGATAGAEDEAVSLFGAQLQGPFA